MRSKDVEDSSKYNSKSQKKCD